MRRFKEHFDKLYNEADSKNGVLDGYFQLRSLYINELPEFFKDIIIKGHLALSFNNIKSFKNFPKKVESLDIAFNNFSSLEGTPECRKLTVTNNPSLFNFEGLEENNKTSLGYISGWRSNFNTLKGLQNLKGIQHLDLNYNFELRSLKYMPHLKKIEHETQLVDFTACHLDSFKYLYDDNDSIDVLEVGRNEFKSLDGLGRVEGIVISANDPPITREQIFGHFRKNNIPLPHHITI
jgi:hypothetical protein